MSIDAVIGRAQSGRDRGAAEPARFALLGLLLGNPAHGYDLSRHFLPSAALGDVIHLKASHLYALLARLERDALITGELHDAGNHPQRRVYRLTDAGRESVLAWIEEPVSHPRGMRIEFPLKLYIARSLGGARDTELIERQRAALHEYIARLERDEKPGDSSGDTAFINLMRLGRIGRAEAALDWLEHCVEPE